MGKVLRSVGLDVGTTTTQLILSELTVENQAGAFAVPKMEITGRRLLYESPVCFTPLEGQDLVDGAALRQWVAREYVNAGIDRQSVDTGAIIITGETSRKENARRVLEELSGFAGDFVVATAGPDLESVLAAKGAGAVAYAAQTGKTVLHMDIGGGTANLAYIEGGDITATGCLNVGGRLIKRSNTGVVTYVSPVLEGFTDLRPGDYPREGQIEALAQILTQGLEMAAGLWPRTELLDKLLTREAAHIWTCPRAQEISFSGGVADCIEKEIRPMTYGDMGPELGQAIRKSRLCQGDYRLGEQTIRATVIGAGSYSTQLSGSTVFYQNVTLPIKNLPVAACKPNRESIRQALAQTDSDQAVLALQTPENPDYAQVNSIAEAVFEVVGNEPLYIATTQDVAKALGQSLSLLRRPNAPCLCMDGVQLHSGSFLDIGAPVGPALPVVIKTLVLKG